MFVERKKLCPFHVLAAILAIITLGLVANRPLYKTEQHLYMDQCLISLIVGGLLLTLHLVSMSILFEGYTNIGLFFAIGEGVIVFAIAGVLLLVYGVNYLKPSTQSSILPGGISRAKDYNYIMGAGGTAISAAVVFLFEFIFILRMSGKLNTRHRH